MGYFKNLKDFLARGVGNWQTNFTKFIKNSNAVGVARAGREIEMFIHRSGISVEFQNYVRVFPLKQSLK